MSQHYQSLLQTHTAQHSTQHSSEVNKARTHTHPFCPSATNRTLQRTLQILEHSRCIAHSPEAATPFVPRGTADPSRSREPDTRIHTATRQGRPVVLSNLHFTPSPVGVCMRTTECRSAAGDSAKQQHMLAALRWRPPARGRACRSHVARDVSAAGICERAFSNASW